MSTQALANVAQAPSLLAKVAGRYGVEANRMLATLKQTAFRQKEGEVTNEQMMALLIVADQYKLNPFTREIYAFPDKNNGIVPVVGVDGWARIINEHPQFDGVEFVDGPPDDKTGIPEWIEAVIHRKDRTHPTRAREYFVECKRGAIPWQTHPRRMLRHKALIQGARIAFAFAGFFDPDEAAQIVQNMEVDPMPITAKPPAQKGVDALRAAATKATDIEATPAEEADPRSESKPSDKQQTTSDFIADMERGEATQKQ